MKKFHALALIVLLLFGMATTVFAQGKAEAADGQLPRVTWKLSHTQDPKSTYQLGAVTMKEYVEEQTNGRFTINVHHSGELGWEREVLEAMQVGTIEATIPALGPFATFVDSYNVFNLPFVFKDADHMLQAYEHPVMDKLIEDARKGGFEVAVHCLPTFRYPMYNGRPVRRPADFRGLKMRTMAVPAHVDAYQALGAQVVTSAFSEVYTMLQMGAIDGNENYYMNLYTMKFHEQSDYISNLPVTNNAAAFVFSEAKFSALPQEYKDILLEGARRGAEAMNSVALEEEEYALAKMVEYGLEKVFIDDFTPFIDATKPVSEKYLKMMEPWVTDVYNTIMGLAY